MTREDINDIINAICPNDEDYEKPCISPKYLRQELEQLALDQRQWNEEPTTKNNLVVDCISRADVLKLMQDNWHTHNGDWAMQESMDDIRALPSATPQEPRCKECKWWKDSDGEYRRGCGAESQCPINRREVFEGNGYCYIYEPQKSEDKE